MKVTEYLKSLCKKSMFSQLNKVSQNQKSLAAFHGTVPAGCPDSRFLTSSFILGGTREEWPTNRSKQKTLTHGQKKILHWTQRDFTNQIRKCLYVPENSKPLCKNSMLSSLGQVSHTKTLLCLCKAKTFVSLSRETYFQKKLQKAYFQNFTSINV